MSQEKQKSRAGSSGEILFQQPSTSGDGAASGSGEGKEGTKRDLAAHAPQQSPSWVGSQQGPSSAASHGMVGDQREQDKQNLALAGEELEEMDKWGKGGGLLL